MSKKIYFIRHAKSSWNEKYQSDFQRELNKRGNSDALMMSKRLLKYEIFPDLVISSPAIRAKLTAQIISKELNYDKIEFDDSLYESSVSAYLSCIQNIDEKFDKVFLIAHNPTITQVCEKLSNIIITNMPTCSIVCIEFESFKNLTNAKALFFDFPKSAAIIKYC